MENKEIFCQRLVHLDLKGAPPTLNYLLKIIPLFRQWGATGILVEYEDMFPYKGDLNCLSRKQAYTLDDIKVLQDVARQEGLLLIPLIQSFGHVEFLLKHRQFSKLRELPNNPMALCPSNKDSLPLIQSIIEQIMTEHENLEYLHIGGDEVFCICACKECSFACKKITKARLYLSHMVSLIYYIHSKWPSLKVMLWDDMFREFTTANLEELASVSGCVVPTVWSYLEDLSPVFPVGMFDRFGEVFDEIWVASSFKGSAGPTCDWVPVPHYVNNQLAWIALLSQLRPEVKAKIKGIVLTGWSRYDHFSTLCELLPVSLPSLAICLAVVKHRQFTPDLHASVSRELGYLRPFPLERKISQFEDTCGNFPGSEILSYISHLEHANCQFKMAQERVDGWLDPWHIEVKKQFNDCHLDFACTMLNSCLQIYEAVKWPLEECLSFHFDGESVNEFITVKVDGNMKKSLDLLTKLRSIKSTRPVGSDPSIVD